MGIYNEGKMIAEFRKTGPYNKEVGFRFTKCFKSATIVVGFWKYVLRIDL